MATKGTGERRSARIKQSKQSLLEEREETRPLSTIKRTRKKLLVANTEASTSDTRVHSSHSENATAGESGKRSKMSDQPPAKRKFKLLNAKERKSMLKFLDSDLHDTVLAEVVKNDLKQQSLADNLKSLIEVLCDDHECLLTKLITCHRKCFAQLYIDCKKMADPMLNFQICWHNQCSTFLLSDDHNIAVLNLKELPGCDISSTRDAWLYFCSANGAAVPESNPVMMTITATIYRVLLDCVLNFQESLTTPNGSVAVSEYTDGDDVYYRFGGAAICDMLKLHYKQIRSCSDKQRDHISQEIVILQAIKTDDKSIIPEYLKYRDQGYMYFPHASFIPFLKTVDNTVKTVVNSNGLEENGSELIKVCMCCVILHSHCMLCIFSL